MIGGVIGLSCLMTKAGTHTRYVVELVPEVCTGIGAAYQVSPVSWSIKYVMSDAGCRKSGATTILKRFVVSVASAGVAKIEVQMMAVRQYFVELVMLISMDRFCIFLRLMGLIFCTLSSIYSDLAGERSTCFRPPLFAVLAILVILFCEVSWACFPQHSILFCGQINPHLGQVGNLGRYRAMLFFGHTFDF